MFSINSYQNLQTSYTSLISQEHLRVHGKETTQNKEETDSTKPQDLTKNFTNLSHLSSLKNVSNAVGILETTKESILEAIDLLKNAKNIISEDTNSSKLQTLYKKELDDIVSSIKDISNNTKYNNNPLLNDNQDLSFVTDIENGKIEKISLRSINPTDMGNFSERNIQNQLFYFENEAFETVKLQRGTSEIEIELGYKEVQGLGSLSKALSNLGVENGILESSYDVEYRAFLDGDRAIKAGSTPDDFKINDKLIGEIEVEENDSNSNLKNLINTFKDETGLVASNENGVFSLKSEDGRAIKIDGNNKSLGDLNLADTRNIPNKNIEAEATFTPGDTLSEYEFDIGQKVFVTELSITEFDGDRGKYNVYAQEGDNEPIKIGDQVQASGHNVSLTSNISVDEVFADKILIRPLTSDGREGVGEGLGGWWLLENVSLKGKPNVSFIQQGEMNVKQQGILAPSSNNILEFTLHRQSLNDISIRSDEDKQIADFMIDDALQSLEHFLSSIETQKSIFDTQNELNLEKLRINNTVVKNEEKIENESFESPSEVKQNILKESSGFANAHMAISQNRALDLLFDDSNMTLFENDKKGKKGNAFGFANLSFNKPKNNSTLLSIEV
jgi:hypothetical protein